MNGKTTISRPPLQNPVQPSNSFKTVRNITQKGINTYKSSTTNGKIIFFILLSLFILLIAYIIYLAVKASQKRSKESPIIVNQILDAYVSRPAFQLPDVIQGMNQSFSTWIYVKDWNYKFGQYKNILWKGNPPNNAIATTNSSPTISNNHCPSIWLYPLTNSLKVMTSTSAPEQVESCDIQNIPLMAWVHIVYVLNNRTVDIYINGKLERSCALRGIPTISSDPVYITSGNPLAGFYGKIGKTQYFIRALLPNEVTRLYEQGPFSYNSLYFNFFTKDNKSIDNQSNNSCSKQS